MENESRKPGRNGDGGPRKPGKDGVVRQLSLESRLQFQSYREITTQLHEELSRLSYYLEFNGRKLSVAAMLNAIVLDFMHRHPGEREDAVRWGLQRLEDLSRHEEGADPVPLLTREPPHPPKGGKPKK